MSRFDPFSRFRRRHPSPESDPVEAIARFYDSNHDAFLRVYGDVIQAFRTRDVTKLLDYQFESIGFRDGDRALDAGCGIGGPALHFAARSAVRIEGLTLSRAQEAEASRRIAAHPAGDRVTVRRGDYHEAARTFGNEAFDVVYFLESFGHSPDPHGALAAAWDVLRPGGTLYIKDLFRREPALPGHDEKIQAEVDKINAAYRYNIADLYDVLRSIRGLGFILQFLKTIDVPLEDFENLTISNDFQELTGIGKIENWEEYVFPVDFFELKCMKPVHEIDLGNSRYFLQNLFHLEVLKTKKKDL